MAHIDGREGRVAILSSSNMIENAFLLSESDPVGNPNYFLDLIEPPKRRDPKGDGYFALRTDLPQGELQAFYFGEGHV